MLMDSHTFHRQLRRNLPDGISLKRTLQTSFLLGGKHRQRIVEIEFRQKGSVSIFAELLRNFAFGATEPFVIARDLLQVEVLDEFPGQDMRPLPESCPPPLRGAKDCRRVLASRTDSVLPLTQGGVSRGASGLCPSHGSDLCPCAAQRAPALG